MTPEEAIDIARQIVPAEYVLDRYAEIGQEYWFNYRRSDGEAIIGASLVCISKESGDVTLRNRMEDFPKVMTAWNKAVKTIVPNEANR